MSLAPICIFVYNRPHHLRTTLQRLLQNAEAAESPLYVFSDGPRSERDIPLVQEVRKELHAIKGFKSVQIIEREKNLGLARSVIEGVTHVLEEHPFVIVLEDDLMVSPYFLKFMNDSLKAFENDTTVACVHGYVPPIKNPSRSCFFMKGAQCWGWATWRHGWKLFEPDGEKLLRQLENQKLLSAFDFDGGYPYTRMLKNQISGLNNSWAIRWHASAFVQQALTLYPPRSLVRNFGFDGSGEHCGTTTGYDVEISQEPVDVERIKTEESREMYEEFRKFYLSIRPGPIARLRGFAGRTLRNWGLKK